MKTLGMVTLLVSAWLAGCNQYGDKQRAWTEDVILDDGTALVIERSVHFTDHNSLAQDSYGADEKDATLKFTGAQATLPAWSAPLIPMVLYRAAQTNDWVIVATTSSCELWYERGAPIPPYWEFRIVQGKWREIALTPQSIGQKTNLFLSYHPGLPAKHVTMQVKRQYWSDERTARKYQQVLSADETLPYCGYWSPPKLPLNKTD